MNGGADIAAGRSKPAAAVQDWRLRRRSGGVLFEVVLAVALFGGAAAFTLNAVRSVFTALDRTRRQQQVIDVARSTLAKLEAGLIPWAELRRGEGSALGGSALGAAWEFDCQVQRTEFTNLSLVELTVRETADENAMSYTLRQLIPLSAPAADDFEPDLLAEHEP